MKVDVAHVVDGQTVGINDLLSLLTGGEGASFASLLDLDGKPGLDASEPDRANGDRRRERNRPNESGNDEGQPPVLRTSNANAISAPMGLQVIPGVVATPWQLESRDFGTSKSEREVSGSRSFTEATSEHAGVVPKSGITAKAQAIADTGLNPEQTPNEDPAEIAPFLDLKDAERAVSSKSDDLRSQGAKLAKVAAPTDTSGLLATSTTSGAADLSADIDDNSVRALIAQTYTDDRHVEISVPEKGIVPNHDTKSDRASQSPAPGLGAPLSDPSMQDGGKQSRLSAPSQGGVVDAASTSSSAAGGRGQGNTGGAHRDTSGSRQAIEAPRFSAPQAPQSGASGALDANDSTRGHSASINSNHPERGPEPAPGAQLKGAVLPQAGEANVPLGLGAAMHGNLRIGVHTEAFGRVTIQTTAQGGQLSAQLSLENAKDSAALAAHLPAVEQKIVQQHGLTASVRLVGGFGGGTGTGSMGRGDSGPSQGDAERYVAAGSTQIEPRTSPERRGPEAALIGSKHFVSSRLDVTV